jgi:hypothetical protein
MDLLTFSLLLSCNALGIGDGCLKRDLNLWCHHDELLYGTGDQQPDCDEPQYDPGYQCGKYDVGGRYGDFTGFVHYFDRETGEHVATMYWTDLMGSYCGDSVYWYGRRVSCEPTCFYDDYYAIFDIPPC